MSKEQINQYYERIEKLLNGASKETYGFAPEEIRQILRWYEDLQQENQSLKDKYNKALSVLAEYYPPCELDGFMDKNVDYCSINCGVDEEVFKECWNRYIEQQLKGDK